MAKKKPSDQPAATTTPEQTTLATKCICAITGCGQLEAHSRLAKMPPEKVAKLAQLEAQDKRRDAIPILYR